MSERSRGSKMQQGCNVWEQIKRKNDENENFKKKPETSIKYKQNVLKGTICLKSQISTTLRVLGRRRIENKFN